LPSAEHHLFHCQSVRYKNTLHVVRSEVLTVVKLDKLFAVIQVKKLYTILSASKFEKVKEGRMPSTLQPLDTSINSPFPCALEQQCIQWVACGDNRLMATGKLK
jgi:hypothetical protein